MLPLFCNESVQHRCTTAQMASVEKKLFFYFARSWGGKEFGKAGIIKKGGDAQPGLAKRRPLLDGRPR